MASKIYGLQTINRGVIPSLFHTIKFHHVAADWANLLTCADGAAICPRGKSTSLLSRKVLISAHNVTATNLSRMCATQIQILKTNSKTNLNATTTVNPTPWHKQWEQTHDFQFHTIWPYSTQNDKNTPLAQIQPYTKPKEPQAHNAPHTPPVRKTTHKARFTRPPQTEADKPKQPSQIKLNQTNQAEWKWTEHKNLGQRPGLVVKSELLAQGFI